MKDTNSETSDEAQLPDEDVQESMLDEQSGEPIDQIQELTAMLKRVQAEFDNYRKRSQEELARSQSRGKVQAVQQFLPALDNFSMSLAHADTSDPQAQQNIITGLQFIAKQFDDTLQTMGCTPIAQVGDTFDATKHEAVQVKEVATQQADTILEVKLQGYVCNDIIVRQAKVVIGKVHTDDTKTEDVA